MGLSNIIINLEIFGDGILYNFLVLNGVNLDLLGTRQSDIYGSGTLVDIENILTQSKLSSSVNFNFFQTNSEQEFIEAIAPSYDAIIINPGAWTHTSIAILDRLLAIEVPYVEIHISNIFARESFRHHSYISSSALGVITGIGIYSYLYAAEFLKDYLDRQKK